ncbi:hypothetical protein ACWKWA_10730 [Dermacoccus abyssi]
MPSTPGDIGTESMHHCQVCRADEPIYSHNDLAATLIDAADVVAELRSQGTCCCTASTLTTARRRSLSSTP